MTGGSFFRDSVSIFTTGHGRCFGVSYEVPPLSPFEAGPALGGGPDDDRTRRRRHPYIAAHAVDGIVRKRARSQIVSG